MPQDNLNHSQNFLTDPGLVRYLVQNAGITTGDVVLEIGPGRGSITKFLVNAAGREGQVIGVELDKKLAEILLDRYQVMPNVQILNEDFLKFDLSSIDPRYIVFSNIPFNITSELLEFLFNPPYAPQAAYLILQEETLESTVSKGKSGQTFKSLLLQPLYEIESVYRFKKTDFFPEPSVETALFYFQKRRQPLINIQKYDLYKDFLAFVSKDRVGEGAWLKVFSKKQLEIIAKTSSLQLNKGLKSQNIESLAAAFTFFSTQSSEILRRVSGAMQSLRTEQKRAELKNAEGGHRRKVR